MVYNWKQGFSIADPETDEIIRKAEMQLCLVESGMNCRKQIRELFEIADMNFFNLFAGEKKESVQQQDGVAGGTVAGNKQELDINRGWLI